jgi:peptidoglycan/LPS O-acetylase OafA/YrhL
MKMWMRMLMPQRADFQNDTMPGLDALRAPLAFCVMAYHLSSRFGTFLSDTHGNMIIAKVGHFSVSAFFVLSGFLLLYPGRAIKPAADFYLSRFRRLAPLFYLVVMIDVAAHLNMGPVPTPGIVLANLTFTFGLIHPNYALVYGGWFIGILAIFYAVYPLLIRLLAKAGWPALLALTVGLWAWSVARTLNGMPMALSPDQRFTVYVTIPNHFWLFGVGGLLAHLRSRLKWRLPVLSALLGIIVMLLLGDHLGGRFSDHFVILTGWVRYAFCLIAAAIVFIASIATTLNTRFEALLCRLGDLSLNLYLLHPVFLVIVSGWIGGWRGLWLTVALTIIFAYLTHQFYEQPLIRRFSPPRKYRSMK